MSAGPAVRSLAQVPGAPLGPGVTGGRCSPTEHGCRGLHQRRLSFAGGARLAGTAGGRGEAWYVITGTGSLDTERAGSFALAPGTAVWLEPGPGYDCRPDGELEVLAVTLRAGSECAGPSRPVVRLADCEPEVTGDREFRVLLSEGLTITQFAGMIPPGRAPAHHHSYDEVVHVLAGQGVVHLDPARDDPDRAGHLDLPAAAGSRTAWRTPARSRCGCSGSSTRPAVPAAKQVVRRRVLAVVLALASAIGYGGSDFAAGLASRSAPVIQITLLASAVSAVFVAAALPFAASPGPSATALAWGFVAGLGGTLGAFALYLGFRHAAFSVAAPLSAVAAAGFSVLAGLLYGERPTTLALTGIVLALPAIVGVSVSAGGEEEEEAGGRRTGTHTGRRAAGVGPTGWSRGRSSRCCSSGSTGRVRAAGCGRWRGHGRRVGGGAGRGRGRAQLRRCAAAGRGCSR